MTQVKGKALVVENEGIIALDIKDTLRKQGFEVKSFQYKKAEFIKNILSENPDFVLLDLDGNFHDFEVLDKLNNYYNLPVIFITGLTKKEFGSYKPVNKNIHMIFKPFNSENLIKLIKKTGLEKKRFLNEFAKPAKDAALQNSHNQISISN